MIVEYRPSVEGLKNIYSKLLTLVGIMTIEYDNSVRDKVIDSYMEDGETKEMAQYIVDYFEYIYGL